MFTDSYHNLPCTHLQSGFGQFGAIRKSGYFCGVVVFPAPPLCPLQCVVGGFCTVFAPKAKRKPQFLTIESRLLVHC